MSQKLASESMKYLRAFQDGTNPLIICREMEYTFSTKKVKSDGVPVLLVPVIDSSIIFLQGQPFRHPKIQVFFYKGQITT